MTLSTKKQKKWFDALKPYEDLYEDIYALLVEENVSYLEKFNISREESSYLAVFLVQTYGHYKDFQTYLKVNISKFSLEKYLCEHLKNQFLVWTNDKNTSAQTDLESRTHDLESMDLNTSVLKLLAINSEYCPFCIFDFTEHFKAV